MADRAGAEITAPHRAEVAALCARIDALQALLACYRTDSHPRESLMVRLDNTKKVEASIRERHGI